MTWGRASQLARSLVRAKKMAEGKWTDRSDRPVWPSVPLTRSKTAHRCGSTVDADGLLDIGQQA
jgi:hypothetical protein